MAYTSEYTKEQQRELAKKKVLKAITKVNTSVVTVFDNEALPAYLKFAARFHYFDVNNVLLIYKQRPTATFVASFKAWEKFNSDCWGQEFHPVFSSSQKGQGIGILVPYILKKRLPVNHGTNLRPGKGGIVSYLDYHVVFVFDKEQTNDISVPVIDWDVLKNPSNREALFNAIKAKASFNIVFSDSPGPNSQFFFKEADTPTGADTLVLNITAKNDYWCLCNLSINTFVSKSLDHLKNRFSETEFQKINECISYMVASYFGLDTSEYVFFFAKAWGDERITKLMGLLNTIQVEAHNIIDSLEEEMIFLKDVYETCSVETANNDIFGLESLYNY